MVLTQKRIQRSRISTFSASHCKLFLINLLHKSNYHQHGTKLQLWQFTKNKGDKHSATNYQPFSLASTSCKLMEKFIRDTTLHVCNPIIFRPITNWTYQFIKVMNKWREIRKRGEMVCLVYFDFLKALDNVHRQHRQLIELTIYYQKDDSVVKPGQFIFLPGWNQEVLVDRIQFNQVHFTCIQVSQKNQYLVLCFFLSASTWPSKKFRKMDRIYLQMTWNSTRKSHHLNRQISYRKRSTKCLIRHKTLCWNFTHLTDLPWRNHQTVYKTYGWRFMYIQ